LELNGTHQLLVSDDEVTTVGENTNTIKKNAGTLKQAGRLVKVYIQRRQSTWLYLVTKMYNKITIY
jgi:hypothetical protein